MPDDGGQFRPLPVAPFPVSPVPAGVQRPPPSKALAGWALGLSFLPGLTWILSLVFAGVVLARCKEDERDHGRRLAIAALVVLGAWAVLAVVAVSVYLSEQADRDASGKVTSAGDVALVDLRTGDCLEEPEAGDEVFTVHVQPCSSPHRAEVYAVFDLDAPFTNTDDADRKAFGGCLERFEDAVGGSPDRSGLEVFYYAPVTAEQFRASPSVACLVLSPEPVTGTMIGSQV